RENEEPHGTHKRASIAGINKAAQIVADIGRLTARQSDLVALFGSTREAIDGLEQMHTTLEQIRGTEQTPAAAPAEQRKLRLVSASYVLIDKMLTRVGADLIGARLTQ